MTGRERHQDDHGTLTLPTRTIRVCRRGVRKQTEVVRGDATSMADLRYVVDWPVFDEWERLIIERRAVNL